MTTEIDYRLTGGSGGWPARQKEPDLTPDVWWDAGMGAHTTPAGAEVSVHTDPAPLWREVRALAGVRHRRVHALVLQLEVRAEQVRRLR